MAVRSIGDYTFPCRSRQELYGEDNLVHVQWRNNPMMAAAACFRAPKAMPFGEFVAAMVQPWASSDPDFDPATVREWQLEGEPVQPKPDETLHDLGVRHKYLLTFAADVR